MKLAKQFKEDNFALHHLSAESTLSVTLQTGLSALKTPYPFIDSIYCKPLFYLMPT